MSKTVSILSFKSSSDSERRIKLGLIAMLLFSKAFKYPSALSFPTLKLSTEENKAIFLHPILIKYCVALRAESKSSTTTLSHSTSSAILSNITIGVPSFIISLKWLNSWDFWASSETDSINPSIVPLLNISKVLISFSIDSLEIQVITLYPFLSATFSIPLNTFAKKEFRILGIITPIVFVFLFLRFKPITLGL